MSIDQLKYRLHEMKTFEQITEKYIVKFVNVHPEIKELKKRQKRANKIYNASKTTK
jgi:hypothetical protein